MVQGSSASTPSRNLDCMVIKSTQITCWSCFVKQKVAKQMCVVVLYFSQEAKKNTLKLYSSQLPHHRHMPVEILSLFPCLQNTLCIWSSKRSLGRFINNSLWRQKLKMKLTISTKEQLQTGMARVTLSNQLVHEVKNVSPSFSLLQLQIEERCKLD